MMKQRLPAATAAALAVFALACGPASATIDQQKLYKQVYPDAKPKCMDCHVDKTPKKGEGLHELNAYGKKAKSIQEQLDAESYRKAGRAEGAPAS